MNEDSKTDTAVEVKRLSEQLDRVAHVARVMKRFLILGRTRELITMAHNMTGETVSAWVSVCGSHLYISMEVRNLDGFKDPRLMGVLAAWEYQNPKSTASADQASTLCRTFNFNWSFKTIDDVTPTASVYVQAFAKEDSATCRRVVTGYTEGKPEPIYALQCDDGSDKVTPADAVGLPQEGA